MRVTNLQCEYRACPLGIDSLPRFSWWVEEPLPGAQQDAYHIEVSLDPSFSGGATVWDTGDVTSPESVLLPYRGEELLPRTRYFYRVRVRDGGGIWSSWSDQQWFETGKRDEVWAASWITPSDDGDGGPPPFMRKEFSLPADVRSARLYASARGLMELSINGSVVGDHVLSPGWTDYDCRSQYVVHDVTATVRTGSNVIGAILGDGWYSGRIARIRDGERIFGDRPQLLLELRISTADNQEVLICTDGTWSWRTASILSSDIYDGEHEDARLHVSGWNTEPGLLPGWSSVKVVGPANASWNGSTATRPVLDAKVVPPVRRIRELTPIGTQEPRPGHFVYDLGQNVTGWARIRASAPGGTRFTLRYAEMLNQDGTIYTDNLRSARATDSYTCANSDEFVWEPRFTFHGFRYIEVTGPEKMPPGNVTAIVLHNDLESTGSFSCSHTGINQLASNIQWGQRGNYLEAPTDCPQRDERLGWTGDAQIFVGTATFNMGVAPFFDKWMRDLRDAQDSDGTVPSVAPAVRYFRRGKHNDGGPAWSDAMIICPWTIWTRYGDVRVIEESFDSMFRFVESIEASSRNLIRADSLHADDCGYGDWVSMDAPAETAIGATPRDLIGTAYFARCVELLGEMADRVGRSDRSKPLWELHARILEAFRHEFVTAGGRVLGDTQTAYAISLAFDLLPPALRPLAVDRLVHKLELRNWRLDTGFVGTPLLCPVLTRFGRADVAYRLLLQEEFPSWLYSINQGATTMWERWNSYTIADGFGPVEMNSFNHYAYGSIGDWMYSSVAGLRIDMRDPDSPPIIIEPHPGYGLTNARATLRSPVGVAESSWEIQDGTVTVNVTIPANASAHVSLPVESEKVVTRLLHEDATQPITGQTDTGGKTHFAVNAGQWICEYPAGDHATKRYGRIRDGRSKGN